MIHWGALLKLLSFQLSKFITIFVSPIGKTDKVTFSVDAIDEMWRKYFKLLHWKRGRNLCSIHEFQCFILITKQLTNSFRSYWFFWFYYWIIHPDCYVLIVKSNLVGRWNCEIETQLVIWWGGESKQQCTSIN